MTKKSSKEECGREIIDDPSIYGSKGQIWAAEFVAYMKTIVTHSAYNEMPDAVKNDGIIQWEAPSNRSSGLYQFTHIKRRNWWKNKAESIGIDTTKGQWISKTAKKIHPTGEKPCKRCGKVMKIAYVYPKANLINKLKKKFGKDFEISPTETIIDILKKSYVFFGDKLIECIGELLSTKSLKIPNFNNNFDSLMNWIVHEYIPREPSTLSPGVMSNAPDRFDGFHSFNRCCRGKADTGRHAFNLSSYTTDRRVFEFWSEGDWIAADRLNGLVKSKLSGEPCADGGGGPPSADHIGPLSLGFCHRPEFKLLSKAANSAKNNRMSLWDVRYLLDCENRGIQVISWYAKPLWDLRKLDVDSEEKALRLSKMLRDNQRNAMHLLSEIFNTGKFTFLVYLLELKYADRKVEFVNLHSANFLTAHDYLITKQRTTKYSLKQKARRIRIAFESLKNYKRKENRHLFMIRGEKCDLLVKRAIELLQSTTDHLMKLDQFLGGILFSNDNAIPEEDLRKVAEEFPLYDIAVFEEVKKTLGLAMSEVGQDISAMWTNDRYIREQLEF